MIDIWEALRKHQSFAAEHGFGAKWLKMTERRSNEAVASAEAAASARGAAIREEIERLIEESRQIDSLILELNEVKRIRMRIRMANDNHE